MSTQNPSRDGGFIRITRDQRVALLEDVWLTMCSADDLQVMVERREACSPDWRCALHDAMWLLDDLGSQDDEPRAEYWVTLPSARFQAFLVRTRADTISFLSGVDFATDPEGVDSALDVITACDQLAGVLA